MRKKFSLLLVIIILLSNASPTYAGRTIYETDDFKLEREGTDVYVSTLNPLLDGGYEWRTIYKIKNVSKVKEPIDYKMHFNEGAGSSGTDEFPFLEIDGPLDIESLRNDIYFDTYLYERQGDKFIGSKKSYYMDGYARYLLSDKYGQDEEVKVRMKDLVNEKKQWESESKEYYHGGYDKGGRIYSKDGRVEYNGSSKEYSYFLLRGENWRDQKPLPRVFLKFAKEEGPIKVNTNFKDVNKKSWYANYVVKLVEIGGVKGFEDNTFRPNKNITVGEFLKMSISSVTGEDYAASNSIHWAIEVYDDAVKKGIISKNDFSRSKEGLNKNISREDMAYIVTNIDEKLKGNKKLDTDDIMGNIRDYEDISNKRKKAVLQAYSKGLLDGKTTGFDPKGYTTRAEATTVLVRLLER